MKRVAFPHTETKGAGIRSIQWVPTLNAGAGAYLIIGGPANGGPLNCGRLASYVGWATR